MPPSEKIVIPGRGRKHRGLTLVELLVTVAVIGILSSMLLGAYKGSVKRTQAVQCVSNLRRLYVAYQAYVADNKGFIPPVLGPQTEIYSQYDWNQWWWDSAYLGGYLLSDPPARWKDLPESCREMLNCPARPLAHDEYWENRHSTPPVSYVMATGGPSHSLAIENPSQKLFLTEGRQSAVWKSAALTQPEDWIDSRLNTSKRLRSFHGNSRNLLFYDGHVQIFSGSDEEIQSYFGY